MIRVENWRKMETIQGLNNVFCHFPSGEYQVSNAALSIMCRKAGSVLERVYAVKSHHNTSDGAKPGLQEHSPASAAPCLHCPWLWMCCTAPTKRHQKEVQGGWQQNMVWKSQVSSPGGALCPEILLPKGAPALRASRLWELRYQWRHTHAAGLRGRINLQFKCSYWGR